MAIYVHKQYNRLLLGLTGLCFSIVEAIRD